MSLRKIAEAPSPITSLVSHEGVLLVSVSSGQLAYYNSKNNSGENSSSSNSNLQLLLDTHGGIRGLAVDARSGDVFFTDSVRKAVVKLELPPNSAAGSGANAVQNATNNLTMPQLWDSLKNSSENNAGSQAAGAQAWQATQLRSFIDSFMESPLRGPHGIAFDKKGEIYVSDAGAFGDTGLSNPSGSILRTIANCQQVVPLAPSGLAYPAGITCHPKTGCVFVCELAKNRLIRFAPRSSSASSSNTNITATFGSVFHQFSGGMGPIDVAVDVEQDMIYVAKFDFEGAASSGSSSNSEEKANASTSDQPSSTSSEQQNKPTGEVVAIQCSNGQVVGSIAIPGTEITAIACDSANRQLYIAEGSNLYAVQI